MTDARTPFLVRYTLVLVGTHIALTALGMIVVQVFAVAIPSGAIAIIPPMIAALAAGQGWGRAIGAVPDSAAAWRFAVFGGLIALALQLAIAMFALVALSGFQLDTGAMLTLMAIMAVVFVISVLVNRFFVTMGAKACAAEGF